MHHDKSAGNLEIQVPNTNIQIMCPFMHHYVQCAI
jgi:hypothetical protein